MKPNEFICNVSNMQSYMNTVFCSTQRELRDIKDVLYTYRLLFRKYIKSTAILLIYCCKKGNIDMIAIFSLITIH